MHPQLLSNLQLSISLTPSWCDHHHHYNSLWPAFAREEPEDASLHLVAVGHLFRIPIVNSWCCCWLWWWCWLLMISAIIFLNLWRKSRSPTSTCKMTTWRKLKINLTQKPRRRNNLTPWKLGTRENNGLPYGPYELPSVAMNWSWSMYWPLRPCWRIIRK